MTGQAMTSQSAKQPVKCGRFIRSDSSGFICPTPVRFRPGRRGAERAAGIYGAPRGRGACRRPYSWAGQRRAIHPDEAVGPRSFERAAGLEGPSDGELGLSAFFALAGSR
jgi:hypothetical protein